LIEVEESVQVTPEGQPEVIASVTVPLKPPPAARFRVDEAVPPAPMLCEVGDAVIVKSLAGGPVEYVIRRLNRKLCAVEPAQVVSKGP
jgi:hypothetical protein